MDNNENHNEENQSNAQNGPYYDRMQEIAAKNPFQEKDHDFRRGVLTGVSVCFILLAVLFAIWTFTGGTLSSQTVTDKKGDIDYSAIESKLNLLEDYIDSFYLENTDSVKFQEGIYKGLISSLNDPYSTYYTAEEYAQLMESTSGEYCGIGAYVNQDQKTGIITIVKPFEEGPAAKAGILPGDVLYTVEGEQVTGEDLTEVVNHMKGEKGTVVHLEILRGDSTEPIAVEVTRDNVEVPTITYKMMEDKIGYIQVTEFDQVTADQFKAALKDLNKQGMKGLVIDLRNNPGGLLNIVVDMLDDMVGQGMLVYTKDKNGKGDEYKATSKDEFNKPLAVLINGYSASASEVFAGCIQDYGIGSLVGTTSFGKGIVQNIYKLVDGSAIKLTVSKYYTPKGRNIHGTGIEPDVKVELNEDAKEQLSVKDSQDNQLQKAVEVVKEKLK